VARLAETFILTKIKQINRRFGTLFNDQQEARLAELTGMTDTARLVACVKGCGFDEAVYLSLNPGLQQAGFDAAEALFHFLTHGFNEDRDNVCFPLPDGLLALTSLAIPERRYSGQLFRALLFGQLRNPETAARLWDRVDSGLIHWIRGEGGIPYVVMGDSHADHYSRRVWFGEQWLAPLRYLCPEASAGGLANPDSRLQYGPKILHWAETFARHASGVPVFLKFGGIDAEFLWMSRRIRDGIHHFSVEEFERFAQASILSYGRFLDALSAIIDPACLRICSVFPSVLGDADWTEGFLQAHAASVGNIYTMSEDLSIMEIPGLLARTQLRAIYNAGLREMCETRGLVFVDDFTPLIGADGTLDKRYRPRHGQVDHHLDHTASREPLIGIIRAHT
jgi:hypothetical protein